MKTNVWTKRVTNYCESCVLLRWTLKRRRLVSIGVIVCVCFLVYQLLSLKELNVQMSHHISKVAKQVVQKYAFRGSLSSVSAPDTLDVFADHHVLNDMMDTNTNQSNNQQQDGLVTGVPLIVGVLPKFAVLYTKTSDVFRCVLSGEQIPYHYLNDDYCDCVDGSDEPSTNACPNNKFYCTTNSANNEQYISSGKVNDGICDCCDGSDEFKGLSTPLKLTDSQLETIRSSRRLVATPPCPNRCPKH